MSKSSDFHKVTLEVPITYYRKLQRKQRSLLSNGIRLSISQLIMFKVNGKNL